MSRFDWERARLRDAPSRPGVTGESFVNRAARAARSVYGQPSAAFGTVAQEGPKLALKNGLRSLAATAVAMAAGLTRAARGGEVNPVELKPGDEAPDFTLPGSVGRSYHLRDFRGKRAVVVAWFPKAFTGG